MVITIVFIIIVFCRNYVIYLIFNYYYCLLIQIDTMIFLHSRNLDVMALYFLLFTLRVAHILAIFVSASPYNPTMIDTYIVDFC